MNTLSLLKAINSVKNFSITSLFNQQRIETICHIKRSIAIVPSEFIRNKFTIINTKNEKKVNLSKRTLLTPIMNLQQFNATIVLNNCHFGTKNNPNCANKSDTKSAAVTKDVNLFGDNSSNLSLFKKFKLMYKQYWYVLIPVHVITSLGWMVGFYYMLKSGVDVAALLAHVHVGENIVEKAKNSNLGHWAVAYLCFKVATPLRYAVTLGGTTAAIKHLVQSGLIKPIPSKKELMRIYEKKMNQPFTDKETKSNSESK